MKCDVCKEEMDQDETGFYDIKTSTGGHLACMFAHLNKLPIVSEDTLADADPMDWFDR